jgi:hypothetical protein
MSAEYRFRFGQEFLLTALSKYRRQLWWYAWYRALKLIAGLTLLTLVGVCLYTQAPFPALFLGAFVLLLAFAARLDNWLVHRRFRKSPYYDDDMVVRLSDDGVFLRGRAAETRLEWSIITKARRFADGLLLFQGPHLFNWLPDAASDPASCLEAEALVKDRVRDYYDVEPRVRAAAPAHAADI